MTADKETQLQTHHDRLYNIFTDYLGEVEGAFLDGAPLSGEDFHTGKHFLAHGVAGQFKAKKQWLLPHVDDDLSRLIQRLHDRCIYSIRSLHDAVNRLTQADEDADDQGDQARSILRHLHQLDALLGTVFELEEELVSDTVGEAITAEDWDNLDDALQQAANETSGCSSHGKHKMS